MTSHTLSKLGEAMGRRIERKCVRRWGGLPTIRWLLPNDHSHSERQ